MAYNKTQPQAANSYKEQFEFRLTVGENIICQRYFKINHFNLTCVSSLDLYYAIKNCVKMIDDELIDKSKIYCELTAPQVFTDEKQMNEFFKNPYNCARMHAGQGIELTNPEDENRHTFYWNVDHPELAAEQTTDNEYSKCCTETGLPVFKLAFYDNEREVVAYTWEGQYPKYIRSSIDLSNKQGRYYEGKEIVPHSAFIEMMKLHNGNAKAVNAVDAYTISFESYLRYRLVEGRSDLVYKIIRKIVEACNVSDNRKYDTRPAFRNLDNKTGEEVGRKTYKNPLRYTITKSKDN